MKWEGGDDTGNIAVALETATRGFATGTVGQGLSAKAGWHWVAGDRSIMVNHPRPNEQLGHPITVVVRSPWSQGSAAATTDPGNRVGPLRLAPHGTLILTTEIGDPILS